MPWHSWPSVVVLSDVVGISSHYWQGDVVGPFQLVSYDCKTREFVFDRDEEVGHILSNFADKSFKIVCVGGSYRCAVRCLRPSTATICGTPQGLPVVGSVPSRPVPSRACLSALLLYCFSDSTAGAASRTSLACCSARPARTSLTWATPSNRKPRGCGARCRTAGTTSSWLWTVRASTFLPSGR
jgi:hypothetical protein